MTLSLDIAILGTSDAPAAHEFYRTVLSPGAQDYGSFVRLDLHGAGDLGLCSSGTLAEEAGIDDGGTGFRGYIVSYVLDQPSEVGAVVEAARTAGAAVLKPAKKAMFGSFSGVFQAPDGSLWKVASERKRDSAAPSDPPRPNETGIILGVADPRASRDFYSALGMSVDRAYGSKYIDFTPAPGTSRLCLMQRKDLAKDVGVGADGSGFGSLVLSRDAASRDEVELLLQKAESAGGTITVAAAETEWGGYTGHIADPDGVIWKIAHA